MRLAFIITILVFSKYASSTVILDTLYINSGSVTVVDSTLQTCVFNESPTFFIQNKIFEINAGDDLLLHVINNDAVTHTFTIDGLIEAANTILPGSNADFFVNLPTSGIVRFYSDVPQGKLLGASSMIVVGYENYSTYFWNMFEQQCIVTDQIDAGNISAIPSNYIPDIFTINMKVSADLMMDTLSYIHESVGDTIIIAIVNSGNMDHNLHFHGYHLTILSAEINNHMIGWSKDSFPLPVGEVMILQLVPHQSGMFMMHNHNLITVTTNGIYPGGMMSMIEIDP